MNTSDIERKESPSLIIARSDQGFRVYSPLTPGKQYVVSGLPAQPHCTCQEFASHEGDPQWLCPHILAVLKETETASQPPTAPATSAGSGPENPEAGTGRRSAGGKNADGAIMLLKRSVSPDGRIDSLSVEFSCPIGKETPESLKSRAEKILALQGEIAAGFLKGNGNATKQGSANGNGNGAHEAAAAAAQLLAVASMNGRYGRRLFLNILVNGQVLKFFGSDKQLAEAVTTAGYGSVANRLVDGFVLNLPCRALTKPSVDGRYMNVEKILPAQQAVQT